MYLYFLIEVEKRWKANSSCVAFSNLNPKFTNYRNNILNWNRPITTKRAVLGEFIQWPVTELTFFFLAHSQLSFSYSQLFFLTCDFFLSCEASRLEKEYIDNNPHSLVYQKREKSKFHWTLANNHHATIKFTAEISQNKVSFLNIILYKGNGLIS